MKDDNKFSLANLFSGDGSSASASSLRGSNNSATLEPHPSKRNHINPLNALYPPNRLAAEKAAADSGGVAEGSSPPLPFHPNVKSGVLENGFSYVFLPNRSPPGRFEAHLQVFSGSGTLSCVVVADMGVVGVYGIVSRTNS